jgi:hypothetical protein
MIRGKKQTRANKAEAKKDHTQEGAEAIVSTCMRKRIQPHQLRGKTKHRSEDNLVAAGWSDEM